jgi:hypothetical protein
LCFHQAIWNSGVIALALRDETAVVVPRLPEIFLGGCELDFAPFPQIVFHQILKAVEDFRAENVHSEMRKIVPSW